MKRLAMLILSISMLIVASVPMRLASAQVPHKGNALYGDFYCATQSQLPPFQSNVRVVGVLTGSGWGTPDCPSAGEASLLIFSQAVPATAVKSGPLTVHAVCATPNNVSTGLGFANARVVAVTLLDGSYPWGNHGCSSGQKSLLVFTQ